MQSYAQGEAVNQEAVTLEWHMFGRLTAARSNFPSTPCVYVQTDAARYPFRIGKASEGLEARYRGGNGYAIDAAMHGSGNLVFVAAVPKELCEVIESELIWQGRRCLPYNNNGKRTAPVPAAPAGLRGAGLGA
jgi:hypothetical protein